jgi:5-formyltetrahydrofolate cyclo-ligase
MTKAEARKMYVGKRRQLCVRELNTFQAMLLIRFQELNMGYFHLIHSYLPMFDKNEPDPTPLVEWLKFRDPGLHVTYSRINPADFSMTHFLHDENTGFEKNVYGILEPVDGVHIDASEIEMAFVPLLAFDLFGNRVGFGKGYYDRFLDRCSERIVKVGLSFFSPVDSIEDVSFFDKKLDFCITPDRVYAF